MERWKLHSPALEFEQDANWPRIRKSWCGFRSLKLRFGWSEGKKEEHFIGIHFIRVLNATLKALGTAYTGNTTYKNRASAGHDPGAFLALFLRMQKDVQPPVFFIHRVVMAMGPLFVASAVPLRASALGVRPR